MATPEEQQTEIEELKAAVEVLSANNKKLTHELKQSKGQEISQAEFDRIETERDELKKQLHEESKARAATVKELEAVQKQLETETNLTHTELKETAALKAAMAAGVVDVDMAADLAFQYAARSTVEIVDGKRVVKVGDLSIDDAVKAHHSINKYIPATQNGGNNGTRNSGGGSSDVKTMKNSDFSQLTHKDSAAFFASGGRVVDD